MKLKRRGVGAPFTRLSSAMYITFPLAVRQRRLNNILICTRICFLSSLNVDLFKREYLCIG